MEQVKNYQLQYAHRFRGQVLITSLLMLMTLSLLVVSLIEGVLIYAKLLNQQMEVQDNFYHLESAANYLIKEFNTIPTQRCLIKSRDINQSINLLRFKSCQIKIGQSKFHYLINELGEFSCLKTWLDNTLTSTLHWVITVSENGQEMIQVRLALAGPIDACPATSFKVIPSGKISWRYISLNDFKF